MVQFTSEGASTKALSRPGVPPGLRKGGRVKPHVRYDFHHTGIPTAEIREGETYAASVKMYTSDNPGNFRIQWHRFEEGSPFHPLIKTLPHVAFQVDDLEAAIEGDLGSVRASTDIDEHHPLPRERDETS